MKALLLSSVPPCSNYTSGIVLRELVNQAPAKSIVSVAVVHPHWGDAAIDPALNIPHLRLIRPLEHGIAHHHYLFKLKPLLSRWRELRRRRALPKLIQQAVDFGRSHNVDRVWALLETPYPIRMAQPVAQALNVPLYTMVFDSAIWYLQSLFVDRWTIAEVCRAFDRSVSASKCCAVISENMASEYEARYGIRTQIVQHCFDLSLAQTPLDRLPERDTFRIGLAGQIYAWDAWSTLLALGDILKWRIRGRKLIVRYLGRGLGMETKVPRHIEYLGWHNQAEATKLLAECDLLYCPYPFYSAEESVNRLSFPSKIPSYLASARPTFFHGPEYSSVAKFFRDTDSGLVCSTLTKSAVYNEIERIFFEPDLYGRLCRNAVQTLNNYFSLEIMRRNFANFLEFNIN